MTTTTTNELGILRSNYMNPTTDRQRGANAAAVSRYLKSKDIKTLPAGSSIMRQGIMVRGRTFGVVIRFAYNDENHARMVADATAEALADGFYFFERNEVGTSIFVKGRYA